VVEAEDRPLEAGPDWPARLWWTAAGLVLLMWSIQLVSYATAYPSVTVAVVGLGAFGLVVVALSWRTGVGVGGRLGWAVLAASLVGLLLWGFLQVYTSPAYGTDEIAFDQYAAHLVVHGANPYTQSMAPAFASYHVPPDDYTFHLDGRPVTTLSYPALAFLVYVPFLLAGWSSQLAVALNVLAWALAVVLLYAALPPPSRAMAIVVGGFGFYVAYATGGVTDALFLPLLVGAAVSWDRSGEGRGPGAWRSPVLLGLAMAVKQGPWLVLPFILIAVALEAARGRRVSAAGRYLAITAAAFLLPNLVFMALDPRAWVDGVLAPFSSTTVPAGQGLVSLSLFSGIGGGSLDAFRVLSLIVLIGLLAVYAATYPALKPWTFLAPVFALFFATRSFGSYLVALIPAALVAAVTSDRGKRQAPLWPHWPWVATAASAAGAAGIVYALASAPALGLTLESVHTTGSLSTVDEVAVRVANRTGHRLTPHFAVDEGTNLTSFWTARSGPAVLPPRTAAVYDVVAPDVPSMPPLTGGFQVVAFTTDPATVSRTGAFRPTRWHVALTPDAFPAVVPVGQPVVVTAEVLDPFDRPIHRAGIVVSLSQGVYTQDGSEFSYATVNGGQAGASPVTATTDGDGEARFVIRGGVPTADPVFFEANLVDPTEHYPYGYSPVVSVRFGPV
jgi:uncharacterized membrane protein